MTRKTGFDTAKKYPDRPMREAENLTLKQRTARHQKAHPNDENKPRENKGIQWAKSRKTKRDKELKEFYKTHIYTWVSNSRRAWIAIPTEEEE
tara:strand:+ start:1830 stop:2108 length:279 start_codon:yes stop_codon:yes gene_type:complete